MVKTIHTKRHRQRKRFRLRVLVLLLVVFTGITATASIIMLTSFRSRRLPPQPITPLTDEKYYFTDSQYTGVRSRIVSRKSPREQTTLEYPITQNNTINTTIAQAIDALDKDFTESVKRQPERPGSPLTEVASYQVDYQADSTISITTTIHQDTRGAHPIAVSYFWTFDKKSGSTITTKALLGDSTKGMAALRSLILQQLEAVLTKKGVPTRPSDTDITDDALQHFTMTDRDAIVFPFSAGVIAPSSAGEITISIPVKNLADYMRHPLGKMIFNIPDPPKPKPIPTPPVTPPIVQYPSGSSCGSQKCIALTFDDGPGPYTMELLQYLGQYNAKATFFVIGSKVASRVNVVQAAHAQGHQIGNHSWSHPVLTQLSSANVHAQIAQTNTAIQAAIGQSPTVMRPPYGATNARVANIQATHGVASILWSVDTRDWADRNSTIVCNRAVGNARPGAIILMHDIHATTVNAIPCILRQLNTQGYHFVTVHQLLGTLVPGTTYYSSH